MVAYVACATAERGEERLAEPDSSRRPEVAYQFLQDPQRVTPHLDAGEEFIAPFPLDTPLPQYPQGAHVDVSAPIILTVRIVIGEDGTVREVLGSPLAGTSGGDMEASFRAAVDDAVRRWTFVSAAIKRLEPGEDADHDGKPDYTIVLDSTRVPVYLDVRFKFEMVEGIGRVRIDSVH